MPPSPDQPDLQRLDYLQQMLRELREIAETERFNMLAYLIEMAYIEANDMMRGRRPLRIGGEEGDEASDVPLKPAREV
jgi:hypothetical protein